MASSTVHPYLICQFCFDQFIDRASMISHFPSCHIINSTKKTNEIIRLPRLNKNDHAVLQMLKLHRSNDKFISTKRKDKTNTYLQIPLSIGYISSSSKQSSFDDSICNSFEMNDNQSDQEILSNTLNNKFSTSCHLYKYSRREQKNFYASVKRARLKKQSYSSIKKSQKNSLIFNQKNFHIKLPTQITSRQRLNTNSNNSYPLIFDPNFNSLVQISTHKNFHNYFSDINIYFHLLHSIASQEFQIIVNSNDNQHHTSYTAFSFINILRQTMTDYSINLQKTLKRNYFQTFQHNNEQQILTPLKIRRCDQSTTIPCIHVEDNHEHLQTDHILPTRTVIQNEKNNPVQLDLTIIDHQQSNDQLRTEQRNPSVMPIVEKQKPNRSPSPILLKVPKIESTTMDESNLPMTRPRIRIMNESNNNKKQPISRRKISNSTNKLDENSIIKSTRMNTRKSSVKNEIITEICPPFQSIPVILTAKEVSKEWLTHTVFYRCHACSHEEFFNVLSRECMILHISSKHGNMEENFKQRLSHFLNNKGRSLKIFQHYLKWQQPWSDKEIEQIFKLSNK
ncbi:unnamed protein product [Adineta steineri]|uniref:Uncharacterized protein n=1 Tax=Adineta steineri TaxID=433720 RepID=A0A815ANL2_9BILA|nr:unnamed protein product [Adineta steineri]